ncbi:hypothetical protein J6590_073125 [Homalodisca vitripennis]|nr:hypothetical protein J6590_073125 [Homalodisca vitripennis]
MYSAFPTNVWYNQQKCLSRSKSLRQTVYVDRSNAFTEQTKDCGSVSPPLKVKGHGDSRPRSNCQLCNASRVHSPWTYPYESLFLDLPVLEKANKQTYGREELAVFLTLCVPDQKRQTILLLALQQWTVTL